MNCNTSTMVHRPVGVTDIQTSSTAEKSPAVASRFNSTRLQRARGMSSLRARGNYTSRFKYQSSSIPQSRDPSPEKRVVKSERERNEELECDYDHSATILYELLESSKWDEAKRRAVNHPDEARTWILRKDKNMRIRWRLLPLHACIIFQAPTSLISVLIDVYPNATKSKDDQGMLPLHLVFRHKREDSELLQLLLDQHPEAINEKDRRDRTPIDHGRDTKFGVAFVKTYTEAVMKLNRGKPDHKQNYHSPSTHTHGTLPTLSLAEDERRQIEAKYEVHLTALRQGHLIEMKSLKEKHEKDLEAVKSQSGRDVRALKEAFDKEKKRLQQLHSEEMDELRDLLSQQVEKDRLIVESLEDEVSNLHSQLEEEGRQKRRLAQQYEDLQLYSQELREQLDRIVADHRRIQEIAKGQQSELTVSRRKRSQLVQSLLQLEESCRDNEISKNNMVELAGSVQARIDRMMEYDERKSGRPPMTKMAASSKRVVPSRLEMERRRGDEGSSFFKHSPKFHSSPREMPRVPSVDIGFDVEDLDEAFEAAHTLGDEISAITEGSPFWGR